MNGYTIHQDGTVAVMLNGTVKTVTLEEFQAIKKTFDLFFENEKVLWDNGTETVINEGGFKETITGSKSVKVW